MRLLILERDHALYAALLMAADHSLKVVAGDDPLQLIDAASECSIWLGQPDLVAQMLRQGVHPVWVQSTWAGITPLLAADLPKDYSLTRAVGIFGQVMSEYLLTYMLDHERQFLGRLASQVGSQWDSRTPGGLRGRQVVIVGTGEIGQAVAHTLSGFGMDLTGVAKNPRSLVPFNRMGSLDDLGRLVETADYLINLLPDTPDTHDIYDRALFARLKPTALFINAGRGVAVVDADLVAALENNQLAGAVIDVCREEPLPANHLFWHTPRLLLTGHTAAPTLPGAMVELFRDNLARFWAGTAMRGEVDFEHVRFSYPDSPDKIIIKDFSAHVAPGQKVAIVGPTGAGKTTMVNLLMRFYEIADGCIKIDGVPSQDIRREDVHKLFGMVLHEWFLLII